MYRPTSLFFSPVISNLRHISSESMKGVRILLTLSIQCLHFRISNENVEICERTNLLKRKSMKHHHVGIHPPPERGLMRIPFILYRQTIVRQSRPPTIKLVEMSTPNDCLKSILINKATRHPFSRCSLPLENRGISSVEHRYPCLESS